MLLFNIGDAILVDGLVLTASEVKIDESSVTGESDEMKNFPYEEMRINSATTDGDHHTENGAPFLISGTKVVDGTGSMLVLTVGEWTC